MSKVVTIPKDRNPFVVFVNGVKYSYPAGATTEVPDSVADVIERYESSKPKPEPNAGNTGGNSAPSDWNAKEGEPGHVLNRTHYAEKAVGEVLFTTMSSNAFDAEIGGYLYRRDCWMYAGEEYTVLWKDTEYKCVCIEMPGDSGNMVQFLGNLGALTGGESTGEPFAMLITPHVEEPERELYTAIILPLDGYDSEEVFAIKITGLTRVVHELPVSYVKSIVTELKNYVEGYYAPYVDVADLDINVGETKKASRPLELYDAILRSVNGGPKVGLVLRIGGNGYCFYPEFYDGPVSGYQAIVTFSTDEAHNLIKNVCYLYISVDENSDRDGTTVHYTLSELHNFDTEPAE